jgi:hypothetical protein
VIKAQTCSQMTDRTRRMNLVTKTTPVLQFHTTFRLRITENSYKQSLLNKTNTGRVIILPELSNSNLGQQLLLCVIFAN